jgi:hypothetical protein
MLDHGILGAKEERMFFFEKKNQKTFGLWRARCGWRGPQV